MTDAAPDALEALGREGLAALRSGDAARARARFEALIAAGETGVEARLALSMACAMAGEPRDSVRAAQDALAIDRNNLRGILLLADGLAGLGDRRAALAAYGRLSGLAAGMAGLPPAAQAELRRAEQARANLEAELASHVSTRLADAGWDRSAGDQARFSRSVDLMLGRAERDDEAGPDVQAPRAYFMPGLHAVPFPDPAAFPWQVRLEADTGEITRELEPLLADPDVWRPYVEPDERVAVTGHALLNRADWSACFLMRDGETVPDIARRCPATMAALARIGLEDIPGRAPFALFSKLAPGAVIPPHTGFLNTRLVCHLPLIVPEGCWIRVGSQRRTWERGRLLVLDDTIEHEAHNPADATRVVLIFNVWRPDLSAVERGLVRALMAAVDTF